METLSALLDGELQGDAARFAMKRLAHDPLWQRSFGNWQLLGDALRGQAGSVAPADFAARVSAAVAAEPAPRSAPAPAPVAVAAAAPARSTARGRWISGAALAASVAMVAMFVARPFSPDGGAATPAPSAPTESVAARAPGITVAARQEPPSAPAAQPAAAATIAVAEVPRRASDRRWRGQGQRVALRAATRAPATATVARTGTVGEPAPGVAGDPFGPPPVEVVPRPWPRAVLPAAGAFTAGFHGAGASTQSFYPFEPRLPNAGELAPVPASGDERRR